MGAKSCEKSLETFTFDNNRATWSKSLQTFCVANVAEESCTAEIIPVRGPTKHDLFSRVTQPIRSVAHNHTRDSRDNHPDPENQEIFEHQEQPSSCLLNTTLLQVLYAILYVQSTPGKTASPSIMRNLHSGQPIKSEHGFVGIKLQRTHRPHRQRPPSMHSLDQDFTTSH